MSDSPKAIVVGGGISGLACAYKLHQHGVPVALLESGERPGGLMETVERDGFLFESGPQSFQGTAAILQIVRELGIEGELCKADPGAPRFILRHGRLLKIPMSPQAILTSSLLGLGSRWKVASEMFKRTLPQSEEESIAQFVRRKFGHEILEYLVSPFVSGVYAGDPEKLSLRAAFPTLDEWEREHGSILRGAMKSRRSRQGAGPAPALCSFRRGVSALPLAMAAKLGDRIQLRARADAVCLQPKDGSGAVVVEFTRDGRRQALSANALVIATPAHVASNLVAKIALHLANALAGIPYAPVAVSAAGYYDRQIGRAIDGFGVLIPRAEKIRTLGIVWNSSLFPGRAAAGRVLLTSFIGGATDPAVVDEPEHAIAAITRKDGESMLEITGTPIASCTWKHPKALPQYNLGHLHSVESIRETARSVPGLFFAGNYLGGPSIGKCVENGFATAESVSAYLQSTALAG